MSTPDTEWEVRFDKQYTSQLDFGQIWKFGMEVTPSMIKAFLKQELSSRDTYWKEQLQKAQAQGFNKGIESVRCQTIEEARISFLRSEIEKLEGTARDWIGEDNLPKDASVHTIRQREHLIGKVTALTSIITRYKEELKVLESK